MNRFQRLRLRSPLALAILVSAAALWPLPPLATEEAEGVSVVVHGATKPEALLPDGVADIFLGNRRHWPDGTRIKLALLKSEGSQKVFLQTATGRSPKQFWSHWRHIVFSGRGLMPKVFSTEEELVAYVAAEKGAVGQVLTTNQVARSQVSVVRIARGDDE